MKKVLLAAMLLCLFIACKKENAASKTCYTVINVKIVQHPNTYEVTYAGQTDTFKVITQSIYPVGYNTCTGYNWNTNFQQLKP